MTDRLRIATRKGLFRAERRSAGWRLTDPHFLGDEVTAVLSEATGTATGRLWAALRLGHYGAKLHRSEDGGDTWQECTAPAYPPRPAAADRRHPAGGEQPWSVIQIWVLEQANIPTGNRPDGGPGTLWAGDLPGGLFRSTDGGDSWSLCRGLWDRPERADWFGGGYKHPGLHSISIDPRDPRRLLIAVSCGGVWATDDGGDTWSLSAAGMHAPYMPPELRDHPNVQDPHRLARCAAAPDVVWCQHHSGFYRSTDEGATWREIVDAPPSSFGFAVAAHPGKPDVAWRVPATSDAVRLPVDGRVVVTRTTDGGATWEELTHGLPGRHAYHLVLRHGLAVDTTGERLALGSNIGGLWISEDGGESWQEISRDLPPVNAVRFG